MKKLLLVSLALISGSAVIAQPCFNAANNYSVATGPTGVSSGDFNGDGYVDIVTANYGSNNLSVRLGSSEGTYSAVVNYSVGSIPAFVTVSDLNEDGKTDLLCTNSGSGSIAILLGNGDGTFASAVNYSVGTTPYRICVAHFNGDGNLDLVVSNYGSNNISLMLGNGDGTFSTATNTAAGLGPNHLCIGDINGDGKMDVVTANRGSDDLNVLLGNGAGGFSPAVSYSVGSDVYGAFIADFNGDAKLDIATANKNAGNLSIFLGSGAGTFTLLANYTAGSQPHAISGADFNGDGYMDLATANFGSNTLSVLLGNGTGSFSAATNYAVPATPWYIYVADFNKDGKMDLSSPNYYSSNMSIILNCCGVDLNDGLVANYPFNGNANDASGNGNNGTVSGATLTTDRFGNPNSAYSFNGLSDYINIADNASLRPSNISISCWVKSSLNTTQQIIYKGTFSNAANEQYSINITQGANSNYPTFALKRNSGCFAGVGWKEVLNSSSFLQLSQWNHIVATYDGDAIKLYKNNVLISTLTQTGNIDDCAGSELQFGRSWSNFPHYFYGAMDDIRIYNRALNSCEISALYNETVETTTYSVTAGADQTICSGEAALLTVNPNLLPSTYLWSTGATTKSIVVNPLSTTSYYVVSTYTNGYQAGDTVEVAVLPVDLTSGLSAYYPFNGNANDASGNGNNGTVSGATLTTDRFGNINSAYSFDGVNEYIKVDNAVGMNDSSLTYSCWLNISTLPSSGNAAVFIESGSGSGYNYGQVLSVNNNYFAVTGWRITSGNTNGTSIAFDNGTLPSTNTWYHIVFTRSNSLAELYINNQMILSASTNGTTPYANNPFDIYFGTRQNLGLNQFFNGTIDDIRIYNRALTGCEIAALYTETASPAITYSVSAGADQTICSGEAALLTVHPNLLPGTYLWSTGATTKSIFVSPHSTTSYYVVSTYTNGYQAGDTVEVAVLPVDLTNGLSAYYPFNGNADDESGNGNNGIATGVILTTDRFGNNNSAYRFDGINDYIKVSSASGLNNNSYTYSWWVNINTLPANGNAENMLEIGSGSGANYGQISSLNNNYFGQIGWRATSGDVNGTSPGLHSGILPNTNAWYNIVVTRNSTALNLYVNAQLIYSVATNGIDAYYSNPLDIYIGSRHNLGLAQYFNGTIDDIRIYNRALTSCEITALYNEAAPVDTVCSVSLGDDQTICSGSSTNLIANGSSNIISYLWSNGANGHNINVNPDSTTLYFVIANDSNGCQAGDTVTVFVENCTPNSVVPICIVSVDSLTNKNIIIWEKPDSTDIDSFLVYKETNQTDVYSLIGSQDFAAFSAFIDKNSSPAQQAYLYKLASKYNSGQVSGLSHPHKTIHLSISEGVGKTWNLNWNHYEGFNYTGYNIYRSSASKGFTLLTTVSGSLDSYTDLTPPTGKVYYQIEVVNSDGCSPGKKESFSSSKSNIATNATESVNSFALEGFSLYPNPNNGRFIIETGKITKEEITLAMYNTMGELVYETKLIGSKTELALHHITRGIYLIRINSGQGSATARILIE